MNALVEALVLAFFGSVVAVTFAAVLTRFVHQLRGNRYA
jgi:hypothetical protein